MKELTIYLKNSSDPWNFYNCLYYATLIAAYF